MEAVGVVVESVAETVETLCSKLAGEFGLGVAFALPLVVIDGV